MSSALDLVLLPIIPAGNQNRSWLPGLFADKSPRRPARGRQEDLLILFLSITGNAPLPPKQLDDIGAELARTYFKTPGSVTAAQRIVAERLNEFLLDRNLHDTGAGHQGVGLLTQIVLKGNLLYLAQSGPVHAFLLTGQNSAHYYDPQLSGRGLGLRRMPTIRYTHATMAPDDAIILSPNPPPYWSAPVLQDERNHGFESLRHRLLNQSSPGVSGALVQARPGSGEIHFLQPEISSGFRTELAQSGSLSRSSTAIPPSRPRIEIPKAGGVYAKPTQAPVNPTIETGLPSNQASRSPSHAPAAATSSQADQTERRQEQSRQPQINLRPVLSALYFVGGAFWKVIRFIARALGALFVRVLPDSGIFTLPVSTMAFIAIAIPLLVVTVATVVYFQRGRMAQYDAYFARAEETAQEAQASTDPQSQRTTWESTLEQLNLAESYRVTADSKALRAQAQGVLDNLDSIERLDFKPALVQGLKENAHIARMVSTDSDIYMLNATEGVVARATLTSSGYVVDPTFQCGPGPSGGFIIGAIVDITSLPKDNEENATVLGMDANGNLLYCIPGEAPLAAQITPPDSNWNSPQALVYDTGDLYILDAPANAVWIYRGMDFSTQPRLFFDEQIPPMGDVIDIAVNLNDLYLLHLDGHLTVCNFSALSEAPTRCEEPASYTDTRPGLSSGPLIQNAYFTEIKYVQPPDPSIYMLEPRSRAIYHFSVRLNLQRQFRADETLPEGPATAFTISQGNRTVFMAISNRVFYANLP